MPIYRLFSIACCSLSASFTASWHLNLKPVLKGMEDTFLKESPLTSNDSIKQEYLRIEELCSAFHYKYMILIIIINTVQPPLLSFMSHVAL